jgi:GTPase
MMGFVRTALEDADIILFVTDIFEKKFPEEKIIARLQKTNIPVLLLINKVDLEKKEAEKQSLAYWKQTLPNAEILLVSALTGKNIPELLEKILQKLPESPAYFPKDENELSDKPERFFVSEIIREKILLNYHKEVPYSCEVLVESFKEEEAIIKIRAVIIVERDSQKGIMIGHKGEKLKIVGTQSRQEMEKFLNKKVFLELYVKVDKDWRISEQKLKKYGYL